MSTRVTLVFTTDQSEAAAAAAADLLVQRARKRGWRLVRANVRIFRPRRIVMPRRR